MGQDTAPDISGLNVCVFGCYSTSDLYMRNRVLISALRELTATVTEIRPTSAGERTNNAEKLRGPLAAVRGLWRQLAELLSLRSQRQLLRDADLVFVPYPAYIDFFFLKLWSGKTPVMIDAFLRLNATVIDDRKLGRRGGLLDRVTRLLESQVLRRAQAVIIDTPQQRDQLVAQYELASTRVIDVPVGLDESIWQPLPPKTGSQRFRLLFWGTFIPLHGIEHILAAATALQHHSDIEFRLVGDGQTAEAVASTLAGQQHPNVTWHRGIVSTRELRAEIAASDCVLGVFGDGVKAGSVVPYKVHQALACNRPVITRESSALPGDHNSIMLVPGGDPQAIATAVKRAAAAHRSAAIEPTRPVYDALFGAAVVRQRVQHALQSALS